MAEAHAKVTPKEGKMKLAVLDLETDPFQPGRKPEPFVSGYYDGDKYVSIWEPDPITCIDKTVSMLEKEPAACIYWHNGGRFDVFYFRPYIRGSVKIISNRIVSCVIGKHEFRDSYAIMPFPLRSYKKDEIDYEKMEREVREDHREEIIDYLRGDCVYLFELVSTFHEEFGSKLTIGASSLAQLKKFHSFEVGTARYDTELRRDFYFGGRNQCFETGLIYADLTVVDVNSMYPFVMRSMLHPVSTGIVMKDRITENTCFVIAEGVNHGAFPIRTKTGLDFTSESGTFCVSIHEWNAGLETGTFEPSRIISCYDFLQRITFDAFIDHFFAQRKAAKKANDAARDLLYKFTLNSAYGKFAQNPDNFFDYILTSADEVLADPCEHCEGIRQCKKHCHICWRLAGGIDPVREDWGNGIWECKFCNGTGLKWHYSEGNDEYTIWAARPRSAYFHNIATGASITGAARGVLLRGLGCAVRPMYCDTDSIILADHRGLPISESQLGAWKVEARGHFVAICGKKLYCLYSYLPHCEHSIEIGNQCSKCDERRRDGKPVRLSEHVRAPNGREAWVVKKAHKGAQLSGTQLLEIAQGKEIEYASPAPVFKRSGEVKWVSRKIKRTA